MGNFGDMETVVNTIGIISGIVGTLTQCTKKNGFLKDIPTALQVILFSVVLNVGYWSVHIVQSGGALQWHTVAESVLLGFFTAFVTMTGWEKFSYIYHRLKGEVIASRLEKKSQENNK